MPQQSLDVAAQSLVASAARDDEISASADVGDLDSLKKNRLGRARIGIHGATPAGSHLLDIQCEE